jgi:ABC-type antimicrobial peptide transport system permease subunit
MTIWRLVVRSLVHHWRASVSLALGVAVAVAVLAGALLVGDSVRGSLQHLVVDRLGRIDDVLLVDRFFRPQLAQELAARPEFVERFQLAVPAILLQATLQSAETARQASRVTVVAAGPRFAALGSGAPQGIIPPDAIVLNAPLARRLRVRMGDDVLLRLPAIAQIPPDTPLGRKTETIRNRRLTVSQIIPAEGLGRFGLEASQQVAWTAFVAPQTAQTALDQHDGVNAILVAGKSLAEPPSAADEASLQHALAPRLADYGLSLEKTTRGYFNLTSQRMLLEPAVTRAARRAFPSAQPVLTYLANTIAAEDREIPYSTVAALDPVAEPPLGPLRTREGRPLGAIRDDEIVLNEWAADDLMVEPGARIKLVYFKPESTHGRTEEASIELRLAAIVKLEAAAADPAFTPTVKGITDEKSIADWNPPFPFDARRIRSQDEAYWDRYRATPKAFVSLNTGRRLWGSRFGDTTSLRIAPPDEPSGAEQLAARLKIEPASLGFVFRPVKRLGLEAAAGTTPFNLLFLGFSLFLIVAALLLVTLLFRLEIESRAAEIGILEAVGWRQFQVRRAWLLEGSLLALAGGVAGLLLAVGYAWLMLVGLNTWWVDAVASPFVRLYVTPASLVEGYLGGVAACWLTICWSLRQLRGVDTRQLLAGQFTSYSLYQRRRRWVARAGWCSLAAALAGAALGGRQSGDVQAGIFMGAGALLLAGLLLLLWNRLRTIEPGNPVARSSLLATAGLALRNAARNPLRSILTIGLVASASFLIVSISAFHLAPPPAANVRNTGTGGFNIVAQSSQPIYEDLNNVENLPISPTQADRLKPATIFQIRVRAGDDASCLNLYRPQQPRVLGVPRRFIERGGFVWSSTMAKNAQERRNPWLLLSKDYGRMPDGRPIMPVVLDAATAQYSLHLGDWRHPGGLGTVYELPKGAAAGDNVPCLVVGLLKNSMLQGNLITSDKALLANFPATSGFQFFLIDTPADEALAVQNVLVGALGDYGFDAQPAAERLADYLVVQNTYLSTFQALGTLGLLLGTVGLAVVQLRNAIERRAELALLRAVGFRGRLLLWLVLSENVALLAVGLLVGLAAAFIAVSPHLIARDAAVPFRTLAVMLALIISVGLATSLAAIRAVLAAPMVAALRGN